MTYDAQRALELLRLGTRQEDTIFREGQEEAIRHIIEGSGRLLVVQKTGWGKSFVYFIATKLLREAGMGPALLISPLLALMRNQIAAAKRMGVRAVTINSDNQDRWESVEAAIQRDEVDILLISPERLANERFRSEVLASIAGRIALLVVSPPTKTAPVLANENGSSGCGRIFGTTFSEGLGGGSQGRLGCSGGQLVGGIAQVDSLHWQYVAFLKQAAQERCGQRFVS